MGDSAKVKGLDELHQTFREFTPKMVDVTLGALRAGMEPVKDAAIAGCPVGEPSEEGRRLYGGYAGALQDSIRITTGVDGSKVRAFVVAGGKTKRGADVWYAHIVEYAGARAHLIMAVAGRALSFAGTFARSVAHPGAEARPFMRPALDSQASAAVAAAAEYMKKEIS